MSFRASKRGHVLSTVEHKVLLTLDGLKPLLTRVNGLPTESVSPTLSLRQLGSLGTSNCDNSTVSMFIAF